MNNFKVGQKVSYVFTEENKSFKYNGVVKEVSDDHIIVDCPGYWDHLWFDKDNMDCLSFEK